MSDNPVIRYVVAFAALVVAIAGLKASQALVVPLLLSLFIAVLCGPMLFWMTSHKVPTGLAILMIIIVVGLFIGLMSSMVTGSINQFITELPFYQARLNELSQQFISWSGSIADRFGLPVPADAMKNIVNPSQFLDLVGTTLSSFGNIMTNIMLILITVIFILSEMQSWQGKLSFIGRMNPDSKVGEAMARVGENIVHYMKLKLWVSLATGTCVAIWLWILGVDFPLLWALVAFLLNFIPNLGSIIAAIPAVLLALVQLGPIDAALVAAGYIAVNMVMGNVVEPRIMGRGLNLSPLVVFLSLILWGWILGTVGMLLSVPLTMTVKIALENFPETRSIAILLGGAVPDDELEPMSESELSAFSQDGDSEFDTPPR